MKKMFKIQAMLLCAALMVVSCADDRMIDDQEEGDKGVAVSFNVSTAQDKMLQQQQQMPATRAVALSRLADEGLTLEDLITHKYTVQGAPDLCLIETTVEGVNPVLPSADTRANVKTSIDGTFTSLGYRSDAAGFSPDKPDWFYNAPTNSNGTLVTPLQWAWTHRYGRFYAVFPEAKTENKITFSPASYSGTPYVEFEAEQDVKKQKDLMTACSGEVEYQTRGVAPQTNLEFYHALAAVRFAVGQNLSWNKRITKVEIKNAYSKGRYTLPTQFNGKGTWVTGSLAARKDFTLDVSATPVDLRQAPNTVIMGNPMDNYTFYMLPQDLSGVTVVITLESTHPGSTAPNTITIPLTGKWKAGTSKLYKLSQNTSDWTYHLTVTQPSPAAYDATQTGNYGITSYKQALDGTQQPVKWKVVSYQESTDGGVNFGAETTAKPAWLTALSMESGNGGTAAEAGTATLTKDITDRLAAYNKVLHDAVQKGSAGNPYNLSNATGAAGIENTANSYLISAPGYYRIPLVYGNAITNGVKNEHAYKTSNTGYELLTNFKDHAGADIASPYINVQNASDPATQAGIVWTDQSGIVDGLSVTNSGANSYVNFHVPQDKIKNGNAVIAVKNASGTIMWSWHLWFDHSDVLNTIACTNYQGKVYNFTKRTLGSAYRKWDGSAYDKPRVARVKVEQTIANGGTKQFAYIDITQNPGSVKEISSTLYQFGRKDAFPGTDTTLDGSFNKNGGDNMSVKNGIQHPETFYTWGSGWYNGYNQYNLWSMDNTTTGYNDNSVVKTIYDPCPAGFKMPASNAFTGFTTTGQNANTQSQFNVSGAWDWGWNFKAGGSSTATVYFPASGSRDSHGGSLGRVGGNGYYWSAVPLHTNNDCTLYFRSGYVYPQSSHLRSYGFSVRPVADE